MSSARRPLRRTPARMEPHPLAPDLHPPAAAPPLPPRPPQHNAQWRPSVGGNAHDIVQCHNCGYTPESVPAGGECPKCGRYSWEHLTVSERLFPEEPSEADLEAIDPDEPDRDETAINETALDDADA